MASGIKTRFLIISDTHSDDLLHKPTGTFDVAIHCGDLTDESKLSEFETTLDLMLHINAPLKLIIAGNHDFTLDTPVFRDKLADNTTREDAALVKSTYGDFGEARALFETETTKAAGIVFLDEGNHDFRLANGTSLSYRPEDEHIWDIEPDTDVAITHAPPLGVLDYASSKTRAGSPSLFAAVARAKPKMHCFGHVHEAWGAKVVAWRESLSEKPSHFTDIDNDRSNLVESLASLRVGEYDPPEIASEKTAKREGCEERGYCEVRQALKRDQTVFVNAAIEGPCEGVQQHPWVVELDLPRIN